MYKLTKRQIDLESIKSSMRLAMTSCNRPQGIVIIGGNARIYINTGIGDRYFVADRMDDEILRYATFHNGIKQWCWTPAVECFKREWDDFLSEAVELAERLGLRITITQEP